MAGRRVALGREMGLARRSYVFLTPEAVEVDDVEGWGLDVYRSRVLLEDVSFMTLHRVTPWGLAVVTLLVLVIAATFFLAARPEATSPVLLAFAVVLVGLGFRLVLGVHYLSVVGRRSKARMAWHWRPRRAREVFNLLLERVREQQAQGAVPTPAVVTEAQPEAVGAGRTPAP
jgi:hypothetical protein